MAIDTTIIIGTRGSALALAQTKAVADMLVKHNPDVRIETTVIKTKGDIILDTALSKIGDKGLFVKEIESALLEGSIDMAVHSMKDLPTESPAGLSIAAVPLREDPRDVFIGRNGLGLDELPHGATIATGSLRRKAQLLAYRPDLVVSDIRGNVETRLRKFRESALDGIILACAGLKRLGLADQATEVLSVDRMLPAPAQGALGIQIRAGDTAMQQLVGAIDHRESCLATKAERAFLKALEGGCQVPIGAWCTVKDNEIELQGSVLSHNGTRNISDRLTGTTANAAETGTELARRLLNRGADVLLQQCGRSYAN